MIWSIVFPNLYGQFNVTDILMEFPEFFSSRLMKQLSCLQNSHRIFPKCFEPSSFYKIFPSSFHFQKFLIFVSSTPQRLKSTWPPTWFHIWLSLTLSLQKWQDNLSLPLNSSLKWESLPDFLWKNSLYHQGLNKIVHQDLSMWIFPDALMSTVKLQNFCLWN